jgi:hypothetical protein
MAELLGSTLRCERGRAGKGLPAKGAQRGLHRELRAFGLEFCHDSVDFLHRQPEVVEALIGSLRWWIDFGVGQDFGNEDVGAADLEIDARFALLQRADHLGAEHAFIERGRRFRIGTAQVNVVVGELGHVAPP